MPRKTKAAAPKAVSSQITTRITPENTVFVLVSFEGPDGYSLAGGLGTRMRELSEALAEGGYETHLYFVGDPKLPAEEVRVNGKLTLHRWSQWLSKLYPMGCYDGEDAKIDDFTKSFPKAVTDDVIAPRLLEGKRTVVMAEDWHTCWATIALSDHLHSVGSRQPTLILWNCNNVYGCEKLPWTRLAFTSHITTVSRHMKQRMWSFGVNPTVIPNGIPERLLTPVGGDPRKVKDLFDDRSLLVKVARFDPDKRWIQSVEALAGLKREGVPAVMLARGGMEAHGGQVLWTANAAGLNVADVRIPGRPTPAEALAGIAEHKDADLLNLKFFVPEELLRLMYAAADAVLANSGFEPFGLVGLEAMADSGIAFTGATGEEYARSWENAVCIETEDPREIAAALRQLRDDPSLAAHLRAEGRRTAERYTWPVVIDGLRRQLESLAYRQG